MTESTDSATSLRSATAERGEQNDAIERGRYENAVAQKVLARCDCVLLGMCLVALASLALVIRVALLRLDSRERVDIRWVTGSSDSQAAGSSRRRPKETRGGRGELMLHPDSAALLTLAPQLDAAEFGGPQASAAADRADDALPIDKRWQFVFSPGLTEGQYARQLAALGMELGVLETDGSLQYVKGFGGGETKNRRGAGNEDTRHYWTWEGGDLSRADGILLGNAGVRVADEVVLHFLPPETIDKLTQLEKDFQSRPVTEIRLTRFALKRTFRGYEVFVAEQVSK